MNISHVQPKISSLEIPVSEVPRREFLSSLGVTALVGVVGAVAISSQAAQAADELEQKYLEGSAERIAFIDHKSGTAQDEGIDVIVRLTGSVGDWQATLALLADWLTKNQGKYGWMGVMESGPQRIVFRLAPPSINGKAYTADCQPCQMPRCNCSCFVNGGPGGNCKTCKHSRSDHNG
jgi:hypothetical protein